MTDQFISDDNSEQNPNHLQNGDHAAAGGEGDPKSVEYQLEVLQKRVNDKDAYIKQLEEEGKTFRETLEQYNERMKNMEDVTNLLKQSGEQQQQQPNGSNQETALDENVVAERVIETLSKKQAEEQMNNNWAQVEARVKEEFGDAQVINEKMRQIAQDNGMSVADMKETARKSPKAFYRLAGLEGKQEQRPQSPQPTHGSMQAPEDNGQKDLEYYNRLMRENWREYMKPHNQREYRKLLLEQSKK